MNDLKHIGAPWSMARWEQQRGELFSLLGNQMLALGLDPTEDQAIAITDALMRHLYGPYPAHSAEGTSHKVAHAIVNPESAKTCLRCTPSPLPPADRG